MLSSPSSHSLPPPGATQSQAPPTQPVGLLLVPTSYLGPKLAQTLPTSPSSSATRFVFFPLILWFALNHNPHLVPVPPNFTGPRCSRRRQPEFRHGQPPRWWLGRRIRFPSQFRRRLSASRLYPCSIRAIHHQAGNFFLRLCFGLQDHPRPLKHCWCNLVSPDFSKFVEYLAYHWRC